MAITDNMVINQTLTIKNLAKVSKELLFMLFLLALVLVLKPVKADAATFNVVAGSSAISADGSCQLEEAIENINDGTGTHTDCVNTGDAYGTNDTINLPAGTITYSGSGSGSGSGFQSIYGPSLKVVGQGRDSSIIENGRFDLSGSGLATSTALFKDFKMTGSDSGMSVDDYGAVEIDGLELDGEGFEVGNVDAIVVAYNVDDVVIKNTRIHDFKYDTSGSGYSTYTAVTVVAYDGQQTQLGIDKVTVDNCDLGIFMQAAGGGDPDGSGFSTDASQIDANITNSTLTNISNYGGIAAGLGVSIGGDSTVNYTTTNNTFSDISLAGSSSGSGLSVATAIFEGIGGSGTINHTAQNDLYAVGNGNTATNYSQYEEDSGSGTFTTTSLGGNISSDNSFASKLTQSSDKHNETTLADFLGVLGDNGGKVPTLALLDGSPAIDAGTDATSAGVTTDARGTSRPQGTAYDAGAYELAVAQEPYNGNSGGGNNNSGSSNTTTTTNPGLTSPSSSVSQFSNRPITITTPTGTTITGSNTVKEDSLDAQDNDHQYPLGLVNFNFTTNQTDNQVTLTFITDLKPNQVKPRKYNPNTKAYTDIKDYTLTESTVDGKHALVLTYTITDNGDLDLDKTTGVISDPVGLAMTNDTYGKLANTGQNILLTALAGTTITLTAITTLYINKLRAKSPKVKHYFSI